MNQCSLHFKECYVYVLKMYLSAGNIMHGTRFELYRRWYWIYIIYSNTISTLIQGWQWVSTFFMFQKKYFVSKYADNCVSLHCNDIAPSHIHGESISHIWFLYYDEHFSLIFFRSSTFFLVQKKCRCIFLVYLFSYNMIWLEHPTYWITLQNAGRTHIIK